jgi:hypothetical protein
MKIRAIHVSRTLSGTSVKLALYPKSLDSAVKGFPFVSRAHGFYERRSSISQAKRETVAFVRRVCLLLRVEQLNNVPVQPLVGSFVVLHNIE